MPLFNISLAHDVSIYGWAEVEADTLAEAIEKVRADLDDVQTYWDEVTTVDYSTSFNFRVVTADLVVEGGTDLYQLGHVQISKEDASTPLTAEQVNAAVVAQIEE